MDDYVRKAVELANGWAFGSDEDGEFLQPSCTVISCYLSDLEEMPETYQFYLDALAAQLIRQVEEVDGGYVGAHNRFTEVGSRKSLRAECWDEDRTMNTIKAIVDSGVLSE